MDIYIYIWIDDLMDSIIYSIMVFGGMGVHGCVLSIEGSRGARNPLVHGHFSL